MRFDLLGLIMDPFVLMFIAVATGLLFGKVKFGKFSFGTSGALFTGLLIGWAVYEMGARILEKGEEAAGFQAATKMLGNGIIHSYFFNASLIFFVAAVGLLAAKDMGVVLKKYGKKFIILGILVTLVGAGVTYAATAVISGTNAYEIAGVYTGALTSSPGLGAALETAEVHATGYSEEYATLADAEKKMVLGIIDKSGALNLENTKELTDEQKHTYISNAVAGVGVGHAIGYPFGVIIVIFAVNFFASIFKMDVEEEKRRYTAEMAEARGMIINAKEIPTTPFSIVSFTLTCAIGYLVGSIGIYMGPLGYFSLGSTGGVLIMSLVLGYIGKIGPFSFRMDPKVLSILRELCLAFFLGIVGLKYGFKTFDALFGSGISLALTSIVVGVIAMLAGFILGRYVFKLNWIMLSGAICGGMTSTPGLGAAIDALDSDDPAAGYGATYPFALLGMIIFTIVLHKLPLL
jgi:putative transport protein